MAQKKYPDNEDGDIVSEAKERYEIAKVAYLTTRTQAIEDTKFYLGDSDNGWQWPQNITLQRSTVEKRPCLTINVTAQHVNQIVNQVRENPPTGKVLPSSDGADKDTANIIGEVIRNIQSVSSAEDIHNIAIEHAIAGGEGYWRVVTEYASEDSFDQVIKLKPILDPGSVYIDPYTKELDKSDAEWGFVFEDITKDECKRNWPDLDITSWTDDKVKGWVRKDTVRIADYYCLEYVDDMLYQLPDGTAEYKSLIPPEVVKELDQFIESEQLKKRKVKRKQWKIHKLVGNHTSPISTTDWVGSILPIVQVVGKELMVNGEVIKKGLVRDLKDPARMVNYSFSAAVESIALQNKIPYMAAADAIEGYEQIWDKANIENRAYLPYNHVDDAGNQIPMPQRQPPTVIPEAQIKLLQLSVDQMRAASGQQQANFGINSQANSGIGIQRLKLQGEVATYHFLDALNRALKYEIRVLLELICSGKIIDTKRVVRMLGEDGEASHAVLDPTHPQPYSEYGTDQIQKIFNPTIGTYDVAIDTGPSYATKRVEGSAQLTQIAQQNPEIMQVAGDIIMKSLDVPYADKIADRMQKMLPSQLQEQKPGDVPPQAQMAMQQASQHIQQQDAIIAQLHQELQKIQGQQVDAQQKEQRAALEAQNMQLKLQIDHYNAETARLKAMQDAQPEDVTIEAQKLQVEQERIELERQKAQLESETAILVAQIGAQAKPDADADDPIEEKQTDNAIASALQGLQEVLAQMSKPKQVVRDSSGRIVGVA